MGGERLTFSWAFIGDIKVGFDSESWIRRMKSSGILEDRLSGGPHSPCGPEKTQRSGHA